MHAEPFKFDEYAGSGKSLMAAPILLNNLLAVAADIAAIGYKVKKMSDSTEVTGVVPLTTMKSAPVPWSRDDVGCTFVWDAPGTLWDLPDEVYRIIITFTVIPALGSFSFIKTWEVTTKDPEA